MLQNYLPKRYQAETAFVVDSDDNFSEQIDVVIFDRQYSPFVFLHEGQTVIPAESVYAVFEAKQNLNAGHVAYAQKKVASVRTLHRTSLPIPHAGGVFPAKIPPWIIGGILALDSDWTPPLGETLIKSLESDDPLRRLDLGCAAKHGIFVRQVEKNANEALAPEQPGHYETKVEPKAATAFLFELIERLQASGTTPMIDMRAYAKWLT